METWIPSYSKQLSLRVNGQEKFHRESVTGAGIWRMNGRKYKGQTQNAI